MMDHSQHAKQTDEGAGRWVWPLAIGALAITGAVVLAPHVLPALGVGTVDNAQEVYSVMHAPGNSPGSGLAGAINGVLGQVPFIGKALAEGGMFTALTSGVIGIGGVMLGKHLEKHEKPDRKFSMGKLIKYASIITSALIALPSILTGISVGIVFLCRALGDAKLASSAVGMLYDTIGSSHKAAATAGMVGAFAGLTHAATCGAAILPAALGLSKSRKPKEKETLVDGPYEASPDPAINPNYTDGSLALDIKLPRKLAADKPTTATLTLRHKGSGKPVTKEELAVEYTKKLHLYVADESLRDYHHIHPEPTGNPGEFTFSFTPTTSNNYNAWADVTMLREGRNHRLKATLPGALQRPVRAHISRNNTDAEKGMNFQWSSNEPLRKGMPAIVEVNITDALGNPVNDLQPLLGAYAHLVGLSADGKSIIHTHPLGTEPTTPDDRGGPKIRFHVEPDFSGPAQFYLQVRRGGKDAVAEFGQQIYPAQKSARELAGRHEGHTASPAV
ncbi:MAG: hypothetical protein EBV03_08180 [Proteobacteria bacterium]|nr:hypothetical protein [Pseudomonadota bacterium]